MASDDESHRTVTGRSLEVAGIQLTSGPDPKANLAMLTPQVQSAAAAGARLVVMPEATMACVGTRPASVAEPLSGPFGSGITRLADELAVTIVVGMYEPAPDGRAFNTLFLAGPGGRTSYRKIHLFDAFGARESDVIAPGRDLVLADVDGVRVGLATCFDIRFAEQFVALGSAGAQLIVVPASWGDGPGKAEQWDLLTRARASDAQAWLLAVGQAWVPPRGSAPLGIGRTVLVDPLGRVAARLGHEPGVLIGEVDAQVVAGVRASVPVLTLRSSVELAR